MPRHFQPSRRIGSSLLCLICLLASASPSWAQTRADNDARLSDQEKIRRILAQANRQQGDVAPSPGAKSDAAALAAGRIAETSNQLDKFRQLEIERSRSSNKILREVDSAGIASGNDITYPKDWKEKTQARAAGLATMTAKESAIFRALDSTISVDLKKVRFESVIDYLRTKTGLPILLDNAALSEADVSYDSTVSVTLKDVTVRTLLKKILADLGLTYVIRNESVMVVTPGTAKQMMVTRAYYIRDLLPAGHPFFSELQAAALIDMIQSTVEPQSWRANGGNGTIVYDPIRRALVVKQSAEFQSVLSGAAR